MSTTPHNAIMFPGQGSQKSGMAASWQDTPAFARWEQASDILNKDVTALGMTADEETLRQPDNCQVALFVHHCVIFDTWKAAQADADIAQNVLLTAGHSLGEYNALYAAGVLGFEDALRLVDVRARATMEAAVAMPGTMVAALGFDRAVVKEKAAEAGVFMANENAPGQITISGAPEKLEVVKTLLAQAGGGKVVDVAVGAAYHSPHMQAAVEPLGRALDAANWSSAELGIVANVDATLYPAATSVESASSASSASISAQDDEDIATAASVSEQDSADVAAVAQADWPTLLRRQLVNPVLWLDSMNTMIAAGATTFIEMGASTPLSNMLKRVDRKATRTPITSPEQL